MYLYLCSRSLYFSIIICNPLIAKAPSLSYSTLSVETSSSDVHNLIGAVLSTIAIIGIVIGSVVVLSIIITILCCCCICAKAATPVTYVNPQPIVYTSPAAYPLTVTNF